MQVHICGARGSTPAPGPDFVRYGGHTSCVAVAHSDGGLPSLVLDAGTGLQRLNKVFADAGAVFEGSILLSHLHWDHTHGIPFFPAGDRPEARVHLYVPAQEGGATVLEHLMAPPHFPITPAELRGDWKIECLDPGTSMIEGFEVTAAEIPHKGGRTFGYRVVEPFSGLSVAYMSDHSPVNDGPGAFGDGTLHDAALALADGVDLLLHDAQYTQEEFDGPRKWFGHTTMDYAVRLGEKAGAKRTVLFHHDSQRTDDQLDALAASFADRAMPVLAAREGDVITIP